MDLDLPVAAPAGPIALVLPLVVDGVIATDGGWVRNFPLEHAYHNPRVTSIVGFRYVAIRRPIRDEATHDYLRITLFVAPFTVLIPPTPRYNLSILNIPQDDTHTMFYFIAWSAGEQRSYASVWLAKMVSPP